MQSLAYLVLLLAGPQEASPALKKKVDAARAAVEKSPEDAGANLTLGKLLCFDLDDWAGGLPHLAKGSDKDIAAAAAKDLAEKPTAYDYVESADAWLAIEKKQKAIAPKLRERALYHFGQAWPKTDDALAKAKMRERIQALQSKGPESKVLGPFPPGWANIAPTDCRSGLDREFARSGAFSVKVLAPLPNKPAGGMQSWFRTEEIRCAPGTKYTFSCWVLTRDGDFNGGQLTVRFRDGAGKFALLTGPRIDGDLPIWTKLEGEATAPATAVSVDIGFYRDTTKSGVAFVDDISLKQEGKELLKNGSFEGK